MRRKYDLRNKRNFAIIMVLMVAIICIFSLFIYKYSVTSRIFYRVPTGCIIQDVNKNYLNTSEDAILRIRWNDNYYLIYQDKKINLGKKVVVYNTVTGEMNLYGKFYEINADGKIVSHIDETKVSNTNESKFYKLDDREYLLIDKAIVSSDRSVNASNYLLVELDKLGNAKLSNSRLNLKTVSSTILVTSNYKFDIANEKLSFNNLEIDLKKIIGSTNEYKEEKNVDEDKANGDSFNNGATSNASAGDADTTSKNANGNIEEIKSKAKSTSIVKVVSGLRQINVDYVIYDPYSEYNSVYAEVTRVKNPDGVDVVYLPINDSSIVINNLDTNTKYKIDFVYTTFDEDEEKIITHLIDSIEVTTKSPVFDIAVHKFSSTSKTLTYKVTLPVDYVVNKVYINLSFKYRVYDDEGSYTVSNGLESSEIAINASDKIAYGYIDLSEYNIDRDSLLKLTITSAIGEEGLIDVNESYPFRFVR